jgi:uncharacterized protein with NAD-binding domain and iron-sulfur cluster
MSDSNGRQKVAVLGSGVGAMVAAFELTHPAHDGAAKYDVTVYQMGWRLGGKGACGRNLEWHDTIEEHGLHIWLGFYCNAFAALKSCYDELGRPPGTPLATISDALKPQNFITFMDPHGDRWSRWDIAFEPVPGEPWDATPPSLLTYARELLGWMVNALGREEPAPHNWVQRIVQRVRLIEEDIVAGFTSLHIALALLESVCRWALHLPDKDHETFERCLEHFASRLRAAIAQHHFADDDTARRMSQLFDLCVSSLIGLAREGVLRGEKRFSDLDDMELREFLLKHGCRPESLASPALTGYYDIAFAFENGINDDQHRNTGAGSAIHAMLRMCFAYKGAFMWKMQAGMGDTIFAPFYEVLKRRGVKFRFFHKVRSLEPSSDGTSIARVRIGRQADVIGDVEYQPLYQVPMQGGTLPCWPDRPFYEQLVQGESIRESGANLESDWCAWPDVGEVVLEAGRDFDKVILGIPVGGLKEICSPLMRGDVPAAARWTAMVEGLKTVQTQSMQLWFSRDIWELGWKAELMPTQTGSPVERTVLDAYADPYNSWADMTHLLRAETWGGGPGAPKSLIYLCGTLPDEPTPAPGPDPEFPERQLQRVREACRSWLAQHTGAIWPQATPTPGATGLDWNLLVAPEGVDGPARLDSQWLRANIDGTERYVLTVKGSTKFRMRAGETGFSNLVIAGDWVDSGFNVGCVEAATMAGRQASRALCGFPQQIPGEEEGHPVRQPSGATYIARPGDEEMPLPYAFTGLTIRSFPLPADTATLQVMCDRYLNIAPPEVLEYRPLGGLVFMQVATYQSLASRTDREGFFSENEISFNVLVARGRRINGRWEAQDLAFYFPYIYVDNPWAIATGREVFGYPKAWSTLQIPDDPRHPAPVRLDTMVLPVLAPATKLELRPLVEIERHQERRLAEWLHEIRDLGIGLKDYLLGHSGLLAQLDRSLVGEVAQTLTRGRIPVVSLKQYRDVVSPDRACYQAIVNAVMRITKYHGGGLLEGDYRVRIHDYESTPIVRELGLQVNGDGTLSPRAAYWLSFDCTYGEGETLYVKPTA